MRTLVMASLVALFALPAPARAQRSNRTVSLGSGLSTIPGSGKPALVALAAGASWWLEGDVHGTATVTWMAAARETGGRGVAAAAGLAWAPGAARLRPRLGTEVGWEWTWRPEGTVEGLFCVASWVGVEWFSRRDVALTLDVGTRWSHGTALDVRAGVRFGF
jgi:hypothetical protein